MNSVSVRQQLPTIAVHNTNDYSYRRSDPLVFGTSNSTADGRAPSGFWSKISFLPKSLIIIIYEKYERKRVKETHTSNVPVSREFSG